jgi:hypothetical protein
VGEKRTNWFGCLKLARKNVAQPDSELFQHRLRVKAFDFEMKPLTVRDGKEIVLACD